MESHQRSKELHVGYHRVLFLLYINDLPNISKILDFYLFADDTNIYYEGDNLEKLGKKVNKELGKLQLWLNVNRLIFKYK